MGIRILLSLFLLGLSWSAQAATLQRLVVQESPEKISLFCTLDQIPRYHGFMLSSPNRAVIDFQQTTSNIKINQVRMSHRFIQHARMGQPNAQNLRLVFELKQPSDLHIVNWNAGLNGAQGIRIDITPKNSSTSYHPPSQANPSYSKINLHSKAVAVRHAPPKPLRDIIIVIDAGHGGKDPGAMGSQRHEEKAVVLNIAMKLKQLIDQQPGMRAVMTRKGDYYVGLRERLNIARKYNADMFVSIHADAFNNKNSNGASVYALSPSGATSEAARWLAEKENYSELGGVDLSGLDDDNGLLRTVLLDLSQTATINAGLQIGDKVLKSLNGITTLHHNKVEQARFVVLKSPDIPSILVETGFISNPREEINLTNPAYQTRLSHAIFNGLKYHFIEYPPHGTKLEAMMEGKNHLAFQSRGYSR